jgi:hypothetical protein
VDLKLRHSVIDVCTVRTTITISEELLQAAKNLSGKKSQSAAIVTSLEDYVEIKRRLQLLEDLFASRVPHRMRKVKADRRAREWSPAAPLRRPLSPP